MMSLRNSDLATTLCTLRSPCNPSVFPPKWVESPTQWAIKRQYFPLSSSKTKYMGVIHPTTILLKAPQKPYLYFHCSVSTEMDGITVGLEILFHSTQFYFPLG